jgi:hypothetical protein
MAMRVSLRNKFHKAACCGKKTLSFQFRDSSAAKLRQKRFQQSVLDLLYCTNACSGKEIVKAAKGVAGLIRCADQT